MSKQYLFYITFLTIIFFSCSQYKEISFRGNLMNVKSPPGTLQIDNNFFADETEVRTIDYREYMFWMDKIYGENSIEYQQTLWDSTNYFDENGFLILDIEMYYFHPAYSEFPCIAITYDQAVAYTNWRTDRVAEIMLYKKGNILLANNQTKENHFTIQRYLYGDFDWIVKREDVLLPIYKLPSKIEWECFSGIHANLSYGVNLETKYNRKYKKYDKFNTLEHYNSKKSERDIFEVPTYYTESFVKNIYGLYNTIGNVSEMIDTNHYSKGGSWNDSLSNIQINHEFYYDSANPYTGFRNVCSYKLFEIPIEN